MEKILLFLFGLMVTQIFSADAVIIDVKNSVSLCRVSGSCNAARFGNNVNEGDTIVTEAGSSSRIKFSTGTVINVSENSRMVLSVANKKEKKVNAHWGKFDFDVKKADSKSRFKVETPVAVAGTEGTKFSVTVEKESGKTEVNLHSGLLKIASLTGTHEPFLLKPSMGVKLLKDGGVPNPFKMQRDFRRSSTSGSSHQLNRGKKKSTSHFMKSSANSDTQDKTTDVDDDKSSSSANKTTEVIIEVK